MYGAKSFGRKLANVYGKKFMDGLDVPWVLVDCIMGVIWMNMYISILSCKFVRIYGYDKLVFLKTDSQ